jgi:hypothetical protein
MEAHLNPNSSLLEIVDSGDLPAGDRTSLEEVQRFISSQIQ